MAAGTGTTPSPGTGTTIAYKYLIFNHPETANVKTVLKYAYPQVSLQPGYLNFDDADAGDGVDVTYNQAGGTFTVDFEYGGPDPVIGDFTSDQAWCIINNLTLVNNVMPKSGTLELIINANSGFLASTRAADVEYTGDISSSSQESGRQKLDVRQTGLTQTSGM